LALKPAYAEARNNLGNVLKEQGNTDDAIAHYRQALTLRPAYAEAHNNLGTALQELGKMEEAEASYRQALALKPDYAEAHNNLGNVLRELKGNEQAVACYQKAIALDASFAKAHLNLGAVFRRQGRVEEAMAHFQQAASLQPTDGLRIMMAALLPVVARSKDDLLEARGRFERQVAALMSQNLSFTDPFREIGMTNFHLAYHGQNDRDLQVMVAQLYERACPSLLYRAPHCLPGARPRTGGKIRIGFISKFLKSHSIGKTTRGVLANLSRDTFSVCAIFVPPVADDTISTFIKEKADTTIVLPAGLDAARERIAAEELDILFYQDIGMDPFTYFLAFARLAPVQCMSFGHPVTSGIRNMDYFISSESFEPETAEGHYSEQLVKLKSQLAYYYKPEVPSPLKPRARFGLAEADHIYLCPQTLFKFHPDFDGILSGILERDPRGRLVLVGGKVTQWADLLLQRFKRTMPEHLGRITVLPPQRQEDFINLIAVSDVMLDTIHFCGNNSNMEAFAAGTPVVTWPGEFHRGRHTLGFYKAMGIPDCVAKDSGEYVDIAVRLGTDKAYRDGIKARILARNHLLYEDMAVVREFERFFQEAVTAAASRRTTGLKVAVITPYYKETEEVLRQCHESVLAQSYPCVHFLVADGHPADFVADWQAVHIRLPASHHDDGNTPRAIGSFSAINQGFDAIAYLDADNWLRPDHIASLVACHGETGAAVCTSRRTFHRLDGSRMPVKEIGDGITFVDTNCLFLTKEAFRLIPVWAFMPHALSPINDRVIWKAVIKGGLSHADTGMTTVAYRTQWAAHYLAVNETPPPGAKPVDALLPSARWWNGLPREARSAYESLMGFTLNL
jgi:predicted O-linked N-acetylglucosamine transferase (SPINDLY family)